MTFSSERYLLNEVYRLPVGTLNDEVPIRFQVVLWGELRIIAEPDKGDPLEDAALYYLIRMAAIARSVHARVTVHTRNVPGRGQVPDTVRIPASLVPIGLYRHLPQRVQTAVARAFREHWGFPYELFGQATSPVD